MICIEPEVIHRCPANRIGVLIGRKSFCAPGDGACVLTNVPWCAAVSSVSQRPIVWPARMLRWRMKANIGYINPGRQRHTEGLNRTIQVHVKESILIVPDSSRRISYLIAHEPNPIITVIGLNLGYSCARICPSLNSRLHSHRVTGRRKYEIGRATAGRKLLIGEIVKHVALIRVRLAPGVLMGSDVGGFAIIGRPRVLGWDQVSHINQDPVRHTIVIVAAVIVGVRRKGSGERIDPGA